MVGGKSNEITARDDMMPRSLTIIAEPIDDCRVQGERIGVSVDRRAAFIANDLKAIANRAYVSPQLAMLAIAGDPGLPSSKNGRCEPAYSGDPGDGSYRPIPAMGGLAVGFLSYSIGFWLGFGATTAARDWGGDCLIVAGCVVGIPRGVWVLDLWSSGVLLASHLSFIPFSSAPCFGFSHGLWISA
jgi:hypothetical protein